MAPASSHLPTRRPQSVIIVAALQVALLLCLFAVPVSTSSYTAATIDDDYCVQSLSGYVGGGNYTYYRLAQEGEVMLSLRSVSGDADIYVSQSTLLPTWQTEENDLQSATCGEDRIEIPAHFRRPMGIGIYGHPSHDISAYRLCVNLAPGGGSGDTNVDGKRDDSDYDYNSYGDEEGNGYSGSAHVPFRGGYDKETGEGEDSILWTVIISILKIIVEVFM